HHCYLHSFPTRRSSDLFLKEPLERKFHHEKMFPDGVGGFFLEGFFELFEVILSYVTNTLSFLRVGGFVLSHAGLMLVVKSLANGDRKSTRLNSSHVKIS